MQQIKLNGRTFAAIELPEDFKEVEIVSYSVAGTWLAEANTSYLNARKVFLGKKGNFEIIGFTHSLTEDQWAGIVNVVAEMGIKETDSYSALWRNYQHEIPQHVFLTFSTATESGHSLLASNGITSNNTLLIEIL